jgi:hypothetical protein
MSDRSIKAAVAVALVIGAWLTFAGCTSAYTITAASLTAAERTVQAATEQFPAFDADKRKSIVLAATSREQGAKALADWDVTADKVAKAIEGAHASVRLGADGLKGVREGLRKPGELSSWIGPALRVGVDLVRLLEAVGLKLKGMP